MIREFTIADLAGFEPNGMSDVRARMEQLESADWWKYTMENGGIVKAITCFIEEQPDEWAVFCLIGKQFNARDSLELIRFMKRARAQLRPKKLWTISLPTKKVSRWHRFLGFVLVKRQEFQGQIYNLWVMT